MAYPAKKRRTLLSFFKIAAVAIFLLVTISSVAAGSLFYYTLLLDLPTVDSLKDYRPSIATRVYSDNNELIDEFYLEDRKLINIAEVPKVVTQAFIAAEDSRFFQHQGFDLQGIARALYKNIASGKIVQGGSTITQQVAKSLYLSPERTYLRKFKEAVLAYKIDRYLSKEEILHLYLNHIYLGHGTYGIEAAAQGYFGKSARVLTLPEAALLAGLPRAPNHYSPYRNYERAKQRQSYVLDRMEQEKYITPQENKRAQAAPLRLRSIKPKDKIAPYFIEHVRRYVMDKYGSDALYKEGLEIYTTININMQKAARDAVDRGLAEMEGRAGYPKGLVQGALLCMDAKTGAIRAMVGGRDFTQSEFNRATQSKRQPGSAFKPFIYAAAFDQGMNPATTILDAPVAYPDPWRDEIWRPKNFDDKHLGPTTLRNGLVHSRNIVTIKVLEEIGVDYATDYAANLGITSPLAKYLSLALGSSVVTLQEMVRAYGVFAAEGRRTTPFFIKKIVDRTGHVFEEAKIVSEQVIDPRIAYQTTHIMQDVVETGTGRRVKSLGRPVAGKTGTTNDVRDAWFIGFTPSLVAGVWIGFDDEKTLGNQEVGGRAAAPIWLYFMERALQGTAVEQFNVPEGIAFVKVNPKTGQQVNSSFEGAIQEAFIEGQQPGEKTE